LALREFSLHVRLPILSEGPRTRGARAAPIASQFRPFTHFRCKAFAKNADEMSRRKRWRTPACRTNPL